MAKLVLISTYWNVNIINTFAISLLLSVLISTYWNVNLISLRFYTKSRIVLISTYWNVNFEKKINKNDVTEF